MKKKFELSSESSITLKDKEQFDNQLRKKTSYRGFASIDQEMERLIALQWFSASRSDFQHEHITLKGHF